MKTLSEHQALTRLQRIKRAYQSEIKIVYEPRAKDCRVCETKGACCTDAHFVNVHITRLEAVAIRDTLTRSPRFTEAQIAAMYQRAKSTVAQYDLRPTPNDARNFRQTFACPLFDKSYGCPIHARAKPAPCVQHGCYESWEDLPPAQLQWTAERRAEQLNNQVYGAAWAWLPLPVWLALTAPFEVNTELALLLRVWETQGASSTLKIGNAAYHYQQQPHRHRARQRSLPILKLNG